MLFVDCPPAFYLHAVHSTEVYCKSYLQGAVGHFMKVWRAHKHARAQCMVDCFCRSGTNGNKFITGATLSIGLINMDATGLHG